MKTKTFLPALLCAIAIVTPAHAQMSAEELADIIDQVAQANKVEPEAAEVAEDGLGKEDRERTAIVDNAMRQIALSSDPKIAQTILLPDYPSLAAMKAALRHENAWERTSRSFHENEAMVEALAGLSFPAGGLLYSEWACDTGRMENVAKQYIDVVDMLVTVYPERLLLQSALKSRNLSGYPSTKECSRGNLELLRARFQKALGVVLDHASAR